MRFLYATAQATGTATKRPESAIGVPAGGERPGRATFRSQPPGPGLAVKRGSRSARPETRKPADLKGTSPRPALYIGDSTCPAGCSPLAPNERAPPGSRACELDRCTQYVRYDKTM